MERQKVREVIDNLPPKMNVLYCALFGRGDVSISSLAEELGLGVDRHPQQALGPYITRLNRRLAKHRMKVEPGRLKKTYRLVAL